jgi:hypothetical protein
LFTIIHTDGTEEVHGERPTIAIVLAAIGAPALDTVMIGRANTPLDDQIMLVDDTGALRDLPVNAKATALYHAVCKPGNPHQIHGDVVVTYDRYFG